MHVDRLARFESPDYPVLSVYVNREAQHASVRARLSDLLKPIRSTTHLDHDAQMSLRADLKNVVGLADRIDADRFPATAIFACQGGGLFEYVPISTAVWDVATIADRPYLRPLRSIAPSETVAVAIVDRKHAWLYRWDESGLRLVEVVEESEEHKGNYGGFSGYEERGARSHAEALEQRHFRAVADRMFEHHRQMSFDKVVVGGHEETIAHFGAVLHPYLRDRLIGSFIIDPHTMAEADVAKRVDALVLDAHSAEEEAVAVRVAQTADEGGKAVLGLSRVLEALNAGAVEHLVVAGRFTRDGVICPTCRRVGRDGGGCPACGSAIVRVDDVIDAAMEQVLRTGGTAQQISVSSPIDRHGVAAFVRFTVGA